MDEKQIVKLEAKIIALQDEVNRCKAAYKAAQRQNSVFEALVDELHKVVVPLKSPNQVAINKSPTTKIIKETLVAHLTDEHADQIILPHQVGNFERYDLRIALRRAETYVDTLLKFTQRTLINYSFDTLWIFAHGDHVSGEIHKGVDQSQYRNMFRNALAIGQMHALMLRDLSPHFKMIKILYLPGNHGRRSPQKDYYGAWDNWDYLVAEIAKLHSQNLSNVEFLIPDAFSICVDIEGFGFCITHGDEIKSWNTIPWYGIERKTRRLTALHAAKHKNVHYYCFAHFHTPGNQDVLNGEVIMNGTWMATSPYIYEKLSTFTVPSQWLHGVHPEFGITWRLKMNLKTEREHLGPQRYSVILTGEIGQ